VVKVKTLQCSLGWNLPTLTKESLKMPSYIRVENENYMVVTPSGPMLQSGLISDVLTSGGKLIVNMNTGLLRIHRPAKRIYHLCFPNARKQLSNDIEVALIQLDDFKNSEECYFTITEKDKEIFKTTYINPNWNEFVRQVNYAMRNFK
jgi:hypothetical protein